MNEEKLAELGIDMEDALDRFAGNITLYKKLSLKYLDDTHLESYLAAMESSDYDEAYRHAHALKGVAGNLSLLRLYKLASEVCSALRANEIEQAAQLKESLIEADINAREGLRSL